MIEYRRLADAQLLALVKEDDHIAYTEIYSRYFGVLYAFVQGRLKDQDESKDLIQDLFISLWDKRKVLELSGALESYLYRAVRNKMVNITVRKDIEKRYMDSLYDFIDQDQVRSDYRVREKQFAELIEKEIDALPPKMREIFLLSRIANLNYEEISKETNLSKLTVKSHIQHALKILRKNLKLIFIFFS